MSRLWVRILVFAGLMGTAGVTWGILEAAFFTRSLLTLPPHAPESKAVWALPASLIIALFAVWLAARTVLGDTWKGIRVLLALCPPVFCLVITADIASVLTALDATVIVSIPLAMILLFGIVAVVDLVKMRRKERPPRGERVRTNWLSFAAMLAVWGCALLLLCLAFPPGDYFCLGGFSLVTAWQMGHIALLDLRLWLTRSMLLGGLIAACWSMFLVRQTNQPGAERRILRYAAIGFSAGAVISGLMFGAHAVLLLQTYRVAWNSDAMLATSLWIWGVLGAIGGLMLAGAVHVISAEPEQRMSRLPTAAALAILPVIVFSLWTSGFVRRYDVGRGLLAKAAKVSWPGMFINFDSDPEKDAVRARGDAVIHIRAAAEAEESSGRYDYEHAIRLCDELLSRYPDSAYRSAALFLKYWSQTYNWEPQAALMTHADLNARYPRRRYGAWAHSRPLLLNLMLTGDYQEVVRESRDFTRTPPRYRPYDAEAYAAEVLGLWDDVVRIYRAEIARLQAETEYKSKRYYKDLEKLQDKIKHAESMRAKGVGPRPRTDVEGRVLLAGKPFLGCKVCVVPAGFTHPVSAASTAALRGGLLGVTDGSGRYRISGVPSGEYEVVLVMDPKALPDGHAVQAPGVPYRVAGSSMRLPDISIAPVP